MTATPTACPDITLVLGGTRSGKSEYAEQLAGTITSDVLYIATAENLPGSGSMAERIRRHRERRPSSWATIECPRHLAAHIREKDALHGKKAVLLDCLTLLTSNTLFSLQDTEDLDAFETALKRELDELTDLIAQSEIPWVIVSSETGLGIAAADKTSRNYCDGLGMANRIIAALANRVFLMVAGLPLTLKQD